MVGVRYDDPTYKARYYKLTRAEKLAKQKTYYENNREARIAYYRFYKYGVTAEQYETMLAAQDGLCAICRKPEMVWRKSKIQDLGIDHDHSCCPSSKSCGKCVRGLLCSHCNRGLGAFTDNVQVMRNAITYLGG